VKIKAILSKPLAIAAARKIKRWAEQPEATQRAQFAALMLGVAKTAFGKDHHLTAKTSYEEYKKAVPPRDYEGLKAYFDRVVSGEEDVLWPGKPIYLAKTSGTTSGAKYIPITKESMPNHIDGAKNALFSYIAETGKADFLDGKMIFLQGSPEMETVNGISVGRLSGIVAHHVPSYLQTNRLPSMAANCIDDWETKVDAIVEETLPEDMRLISGIPSWVQMYFEKLIEKSNKKAVKDIFAEFSLFVYGGVNYQPYKKRFEELIGRSVPSIELFPASEGFFAFQDSQKGEGLLLILNAGIFYEFIPAASYFDENPKRVPLWEVEVGVNYVLIINSNAGLYGYNIGDTVKFVSTAPYRLVVTGRIKHFTSAFGEHVIAEEVEKALRIGLEKHGGQVVEFTVAPQITPAEGALPYHEWYIEFGEKPKDLAAFAATLDALMQEQNPYYFDLLKGNILQPLQLTLLGKGGFNAFMKSRGKLGGQNKVPRLSNDRNYADALDAWKI